MKKKNLKQNQAHGKPKKANPPTDSHKKKKKTQNQKSNLPTVPRSRRYRDYRENQSLIY